MGTVAQDNPHTQHAGLHHPCHGCCPRPCWALPLHLHLRRGRRLLQGQLPAVRGQRWHRCRDRILLRQPSRRQDPDRHLQRQRPDRQRCRCPCPRCPRCPRPCSCPRRPRRSPCPRCPCPRCPPRTCPRCCCPRRPCPPRISS